MANQREIAAELGISAMTVSRALSGKPHVSARLREEVRRVAAALGYVPNPLVQSLMRSRVRRGSPQSGLVVAWLGPGLGKPGAKDVPAFADYARGAADRLAQRGFRLENFLPIHRRMGRDPDRFKRILRSRGIPGILLGPAEEDLRLEDMDWSDFSVVQIGRSRLVPGMGRVASDAFRNMVTCHERLGQNGFQRIGFYDSLPHDRRQEGLWQAAHLLMAPGIPPGLEADRRAVGPAGLRRYVAAHRLDAVISGRPEVWAYRTGRLARLGFAGLLGPGLPPEAPGIRVDHAALGAAAAEWLVADILAGRRGLSPEGSTLSLPGRWSDGKKKDGHP